jgi:hypothetical protein
MTFYKLQWSLGNIFVYFINSMLVLNHSNDFIHEVFKAINPKSTDPEIIMEAHVQNFNYAVRNKCLIVHFLFETNHLCFSMKIQSIKWFFRNLLLIGNLETWNFQNEFWVLSLTFIIYINCFFICLHKPSITFQL